VGVVVKLKMGASRKRLEALQGNKTVRIGGKQNGEK
jgi:hypothetical protein